MLETLSVQLHVRVDNPDVQKHYFEIQLIKFESEELKHEGPHEALRQQTKALDFFSYNRL